MEAAFKRFAELEILREDCKDIAALGINSIHLSFIS